MKYPPYRTLTSPDLLDEIRSKSITNSSTGCWEWLGTRSYGGYGQSFVIDGKTYLVHRLVGHLVYGWPLNSRDPQVCHICDNPPRFNPDHLLLGSSTDNNRDTVAKSRHRWSPGPIVCPRGHNVEDNNVVERCGNRICRVCYEEYERIRPHKVKNQRRRCVRGHTLNEANTYWCGDYRDCRECRRVRDKKRNKTRKRKGNNGKVVTQ